MYKISLNKYLYSPSDLISFLECDHCTFMNVQELKNNNIAVVKKNSQLSNTAVLLNKKGLEHEKECLKKLKNDYENVVEIDKSESIENRFKLTYNAMKDAADVIYQASLYGEYWYGDADFLIKCDKPSRFGDYSYEVMDAKLSSNTQVKHIMQLCIYSKLLNNLQDFLPFDMHIFLGNKNIESFKVLDFFFIAFILKRFLKNILENYL